MRLHACYAPAMRMMPTAPTAVFLVALLILARPQNTRSSPSSASSAAATRRRAAAAFVPVAHRHRKNNPPYLFASQRQRWRSSSLPAAAGSDEDDRGTTGAATAPNNDPTIVPPYVESPVLRQVYPALLKHLDEFGNPNIPLGSADGKRCKTLRRLHFQNKLSDAESALLADMGFRFNSFEDVFEEADFDELLEKLVAYEKANKAGYQIPKKYKPDPELGAWVTMIRRIGRGNIEEDRRRKLDDIGFAWVSTRKCGSAFMKNYRTIMERLQEDSNEGDGEKDGVRVVLEDESVKKWIEAQRMAHANGNLSESRVGYMDALPGVDWRKPL